LQRWVEEVVFPVGELDQRGFPIGEIEVGYSREEEVKNGRERMEKPGQTTKKITRNRSMAN